jgi:hypothetical protein
MHRSQRTKAMRSGAISVFSYSSELERGNILNSEAQTESSDLNPIIAFLRTSDEAKLLAKRLAFATTKFKSLHESSLNTANPSAYLNREIEECSAECLKLSDSINQKLLSMSQECNNNQGTISEQRLRGGVSSAQNSSFANQVETFQKDVSQIKEAYEAEMLSKYQLDRNSSELDSVPAVRDHKGHLEHLDQMLVMCNRIFEENPNLQYSELEKQKEWTRIDGQMKMFYPQSSSSVSLPVPKQEEPIKHVSIPVTENEPPRPLSSEESSRQNRLMLSRIFSWKTLKWICGILLVGTLVLVGLLIYSFVQTWKLRSSGK